MTMKKKDLAIDLLEMALARRSEPAALATAMIALDRLATSRPEHATVHYASGRILLLMGQSQLAMGAFRTATEHDPTLAVAHYYEGVAHWLIGQDSEALTKFIHAVHRDPALFDARFDLAQLHYQRGDLVAALEHWKAALELRPDDFATLKKLLQALLALDYHDTARLTHERLRQVWRNSDDPTVRGVRSYVLDQFDVGPLRVVAIESLRPTGDPAVIYTFAASDDAGLAFSVNLETSAFLRATGRGYVLVMTAGDARINTNERYREVPGYHVLKPTAVALIRRHAGLSGGAEGA